MAEVREVFPTLEDASGAGVVLRKVVQGDAHTGKNASPALSFKDPSGNLIYPVTNAQGELVVSSESAQLATLWDEGQNAGSLTVQTLVDIPLLNGYTYRRIEVHVSSFRDSYFEVLWLDNAAETILQRLRVGAGHYNDGSSMLVKEFESGATGPQILRLRGQNLFGVTATFDGDLAVVEIQP